MAASDLLQPSGKIASSAELARRALDAGPSQYVIDARSQLSTTDDEETSIARYGPEQEDTRPPRKSPRRTSSLARNDANDSMLLHKPSQARKSTIFDNNSTSYYTFQKHYILDHTDRWRVESQTATVQI